MEFHMNFFSSRVLNVVDIYKRDGKSISKLGTCYSIMPLPPAGSVTEGRALERAGQRTSEAQGPTPVGAGALLEHGTEQSNGW